MCKKIIDIIFRGSRTLFFALALFLNASMSVFAAVEDEISFSMVYYDSRVGNGNTALNASTPYNYTSNTLTGTIKLQVNILATDLQRDYAAGELQFKVYGLEKFGLTNATVSGSLFSYTHYSGTFNATTRTVENDHYIVRNRSKLSAGTSIDAMFQILYRMGTTSYGCPFNESSGTVWAELGGKKTDALSFEFHIGKQAYTLASWYNRQYDVKSYDGLGENASNYYWMRTDSVSVNTVSPNGALVTRKSAGASTLWRISGIPAGCKVYAIRDFDGTISQFQWNSSEAVYELIDYYNTSYSTYIPFYIYIGAPKSNFNVGDAINYHIEAFREYYYKYNHESYLDNPEKICEGDVQIIVKDTIKDIPGDLIRYTNFISDTYKYGSLLSSEFYYYSGYSFGTNYPYENRIVLGLDGIYVIDAEGESASVDRNIYHMKNVFLPALKNYNYLKYGETWDLYVRYRGANSYILYGSGYENGQEITFGDSDNITGLYAVSSVISGSVGSISSMRSQIAYEAYPEKYEVNGKVGMYGFADILHPYEDTSVFSVQLSEYPSVLSTLNVPASDLSEHGRYLYRKIHETSVIADVFLSTIYNIDRLIENHQGYSDYYIYSFFKSNVYLSCNTILGINAYIVLPQQITLLDNEAAIKENLLSLTFPTTDLSRYAAQSPQFSTESEMRRFLSNSLSVDINQSDGKTTIHLCYNFIEPLDVSIIKDRIVDVFSIIPIKVRVYDADIIDFGSTLNIDSYLQPILGEGVNFISVGYSQQMGQNNITGNGTSSYLTYPDAIDIDGDGDTTERFNEYHSSVTYGKAIESLLELTKLTNNGSGSYTSIPKTVNTDSEYTYRLRATTASTSLTNLVMYDRLEAYVPGSANHWCGTFSRVDLTRSATQGHVPTVYYSSNANAGTLNDDSSWLLLQGSYNPADVKALAFDYGTQVIPSGALISVDIVMTAPSEDSDLYAYNIFDATWSRVDSATNYVYPGTEELESNVTVLALEKPVSETRSVTITKNWDVPETYTKPNTVTVSIMQDDSEYQSNISISAADNWVKTVSSLPRFAENGHEYVYSVVENNDDITITVSYSGSDGNLTILNSYVIPRANIKIQKVWEDNGNSEGYRTQSVCIKLLANGNEIANHTLSGDGDTWTYTFENRITSLGGSDIVYTALEDGEECNAIEVPTDETTCVLADGTWNEGTCTI